MCPNWVLAPQKKKVVTDEFAGPYFQQASGLKNHRCVSGQSDFVKQYLELSTL